MIYIELFLLFFNAYENFLNFMFKLNIFIIGFFKKIKENENLF